MANAVMTRGRRGPAASLHRASSVVLALVLVGSSALSALSGCVATAPEPIPAAIHLPPRGDLQLVETSAHPAAHAGASVRWGGNVIAIERDSAGNALIQVIERRLDADGRPVAGSPSDGRFMIKATAAVDRNFYARDRLITVAGTLDGSATVQVGEKTLAIPLVHVNEFMLWLPNIRDDGPYWGYYDDYRYGPGYGPHIGFGLGLHRYQHGHRP